MWHAVQTQYGDLHVVPLDDLRPHVESDICWCNPTDDDGLWVHHSLDRREEYERGEREIN
jgi:hypothetical protein